MFFVVASTTPLLITVIIIVELLVVFITVRAFIEWNLESALATYTHSLAYSPTHIRTHARTHAHTRVNVISYIMLSNIHIPAAIYRMPLRAEVEVV